MGITLVSFQISGNSPILREKLNNSLRGSEMGTAPFFKEMVANLIRSCGFC